MGKQPNMKRATVASAAALLVLFAAACQSQSARLLEGRASLQGVTLSVSTRSAGTSGLAIDISVKNTGSRAVTLSFSASQAYDIQVKNGLGVVVWQWSHDKYFLQVLWNLELAPGESRSYEGLWDLKGNSGSVVPSGVYSGKAYLTNSPSDPGLVAHFTVTL